VGKEKGARPRIKNKNYETQLKNNPEQWSESTVVNLLNLQFESRDKYNLVESK
jgi:hypothetical protein